MVSIHENILSSYRESNQLDSEIHLIGAKRLSLQKELTEVPVSQV